MGLFDGLLEKKECVVCGKELGLLGKRKLEDGYMCKDCESKLSPWFDERRSSTTEEIMAQLDYRQDNAARLEYFNPTFTMGTGTKVMIDENMGALIVSGSSDWRSKNPDILTFNQIAGCDLDITDGKREEKYRDDEGHFKSYDPPRYAYDYDFYITVHVNSPWFDEMRFKVNTGNIDELGSPEYRDAARQAGEIRGLLLALRAGNRSNLQALAGAVATEVEASLMPDQMPDIQVQFDDVPQKQEPPVEQAFWFCPNCGIKNESNFCPACGTKRPQM